MRPWLFTFFSLAGFAVLVAWVTHWLDTPRPRPSLPLHRRLMARWKRARGLEKAPGDPPEAA